MELNNPREYSLAELFATEKRKIIIPDFQRDYCWGDSTHGEKHDANIVGNFLKTLIEEYLANKASELQLGKIDVYESPKNHIYLTDGQQRLTTLYLIIGLLYKQTKIESLKKCLISDYEETKDDQEPYLQYAVRESTLYFLRDLVNEFFIKENTINVSTINKQFWYFREYDLDPSIISIMLALAIIEKELANLKDLNEFSEFITTKIIIQYFDVINKEQGEERFVIINTTGKSLTVSENIKPILLSNSIDSNFAEKWEDRETYFWKNRNKEKENIADYGVNQFLKWCFQIEDKQNDIDVIKKAKALLKEKNNEVYLKNIQKHFESLKILLEFIKDTIFQTQFKFVNDNKDVNNLIDLRQLSNEKIQNILLPLIAFISKWEDKKEYAYQFLRRLRKNYFDLKWNDRNKNYVDWRYILQIIDKSNSPSSCLLNDEPFVKIGIDLPKSTWFNFEEKLKYELADHKQLLEEWEDHKDFMGDLTPIFNVASDNQNVSELQTYYRLYNELSIDTFSFSKDVKLQNIYRLNLYLSNGQFDYRGVGGYGYCMLNESTEHKFLQVGFPEIWKMCFEKPKIEIYTFLKSRLKLLIKNEIFKNEDLEQIIEDTTKIGHHERVKLWAVLEFLDADEILYYQNSICQFWEYPNLIKIDQIQDINSNNYEIGNLLLGTSYFNNKTGWIKFTDYPLMKKLYKNKDSFNLEQIKARSLNIKRELQNLLNEVAE